MSESFPIPRLTADTDWPNRWNLSNPRAATAKLTRSGSVQLTKTEKYTLHALLNAEGADLHGISGTQGVPASPETAYNVCIHGTKTGDLSAQLAIHEFSGDGSRVERSLLGFGRRVLYVPRQGTERLVLSVRMVGHGSLTLTALDFQPVPGVRSADPGLHELEEAEQNEPALDADNFADLKDILLRRPGFYDRIAAAVDAQLRPVLDEMRSGDEQLRGDVASLLERTEAALASIEAVSRRLEAQELRSAFSEVPGVEVHDD